MGLSKSNKGDFPKAGQIKLPPAEPLPGFCKRLRCLIRKKEIADTPEERVRQALLQRMADELGFPKGLISVEKKVGERRFDIVCYTPEVIPLLLVECKAESMEKGAAEQAMGYNHFLLAPFLCVAGPSALKTLWHEGERQMSVPFLPSFAELYAFSRRR